MRGDEAWHGTSGGYTNHKCRCAACRAAWADYNYQVRRTRERRIKEDPTLAPHGSPHTYANWRCRCAPCTVAWAAYYRTVRARREEGSR